MILWIFAVVMVVSATYRTSYHQHYFHGECFLGRLCAANCGNYHIA